MVKRRKINSKKKRENKKKKKELLDIFLNDFRNNILNYNNDLWSPNFNIKFKSVNSHSFFDIGVHKNIDMDTDPTIDINNPIPKDIKPCYKIRFYPNQIQQKIISDWNNRYIDMYNATLKFLKREFELVKTKKFPIIINKWKSIRTNHIKHIRDKIANTNIFSYIDKKKNKHNVKILAHTLDTAIRLATTMYCNAFDKFRNGNRKKLFRVRYWRKNKKSKMFTIEPCNFEPTIVNKIEVKSILKQHFGEVKVEDFYIDNKKFKLEDVYTTYKCECIIQHIKDPTGNKFYLIVPKKIKPKYEKRKRRNIISIDLGIRTFATGLSDYEVVKIGNCMSEIIEKGLKKIDRLNRSSIIPKKKEKKAN